MFEKDLLVGQVIDHDKLATQTLAEQAKLAKLLSSAVTAPCSHKRRKTEKLQEWANDPFKLVKPSRISPPFTISTTSSSMLIMDFHAHLAHTEIIGLLGGSWDATSMKLEIKGMLHLSYRASGLPMS